MSQQLPQAEAKVRANAVRRALQMEENREVTCENCAHNANCEFAFDPYNTDGDCLAIK